MTASQRPEAGQDKETLRGRPDASTADAAVPPRRQPGSTRSESFLSGQDAGEEGQPQFSVSEEVNLDQHPDDARHVGRLDDEAGESDNPVPAALAQAVGRRTDDTEPADKAGRS